MMTTMRVKQNMAHHTRHPVAAHQAVDSDLWDLCQPQLLPAQSLSAQACYSKSTGQLIKATDRVLLSFACTLGSVMWSQFLTIRTRSYRKTNQTGFLFLTKTFLSRSTKSEYQKQWCNLFFILHFRKDMDHYIYRMQQGKRGAQAHGKHKAKV